MSGNRIVEAVSGVSVLLRGINRSGLEYSSPDGPGSLAKAGIDEGEFDRIVAGWGANIVRVPFTQAWALAREGYDPDPYLLALDTVIEMAARRGAYSLLDLHWIDAVTPRGRTGAGELNFVPPLPDERSVEVWRRLAARYAAEPAVLYDVFNEPHDPLPGDPAAIRRVTMREWQPWATRLVQAIRSVNASALVFVSGTNWAYDLRGHPLPGVDGLVYSTHVYPDKGRDWDAAFGDLASDVPVFAGEWGGEEADLDWGRSLLEYFNDREIGWAAWSWSDRPRLTAGRSAGHAPTPFGELVRSALA